MKSRGIMGVLVPFALFIGTALVLHKAGIGCPIKFVTGVSCPGCGLTRAWLSALGLHVREALAYHPLFWVVPVAFALALIDRGTCHRMVRLGMAALIVAFLAVWMVRMGNPHDATLLVQSAVTTDVVGVETPRWLRFFASLLAQR